MVERDHENPIERVGREEDLARTVDRAVRPLALPHLEQKPEPQPIGGLQSLLERRDRRLGEGARHPGSGVRQP
jgi:hypothetical protein